MESDWSEVKVRILKALSNVNLDSLTHFVSQMGLGYVGASSGDYPSGEANSISKTNV